MSRTRIKIVGLSASQVEARERATSVSFLKRVDEVFRVGFIYLLIFIPTQRFIPRPSPLYMPRGAFRKLLKRERPASMPTHVRSLSQSLLLTAQFRNSAFFTSSTITMKSLH